MNFCFDKRIYGILSFLLFTFTGIPGQTITDSADYFSVANRRLFADYLFIGKDYLRAVDEYRAILKKENDDSLKYKIGIGLSRIGDYTQAADYFKSLFFNPEFIVNAEFEYYKCYFFSNNFNQFRELVESRYFYPFEFDKEINRLKQISMILELDIIPDSLEFVSAFEGSIKNDMIKFYEMKKYPERKYPATAALMSAVIPGSGKIYTGDIGDGITALLLTSICAYLAYDNFKADHDFRGWLFTGLTAFFYAGNIYGSAAAAHLYNAQVQINLYTELNLYLGKNNYFLND